MKNIGAVGEHTLQTGANFWDLVITTSSDDFLKQPEKKQN